MAHGSQITRPARKRSSRLASTSCPRARHATPLQQKNHPPRSAVRPINGSTDQRLMVYGSRFTSDKPGRPSTWWLQLEDLAPIVLDLGELSQWKRRQWQNRQWMRLLRAIEGSTTALVIISAQHLASTVSGLVLELSREKTDWAEKYGFSFLLNGITSEGRVLHQRRLSQWQQKKTCRVEMRS